MRKPKKVSVNQTKKPSRSDYLDRENTNIPDISRRGSPLEHVIERDNVDVERVGNKKKRRL